MLEACWSQTEGPELNQGDYLPGIPVPIFRLPLITGTAVVGAEVEHPTEVQIKDVIVITQTCDLLLEKIRFVALCPIETITELERQQPDLAKEWKNVQKGRREGLHLIGACTNAGDHRNALVVDFREIISLSRGYVEAYASSIGRRHRLRSPFLEHFSQSFGKFYMRVALPDFVNLP
jgi:hypothetical protein